MKKTFDVELKKAQGFPEDYVITGNTTEQTKQIGNAVPVNTAKALALAAMGARRGKIDWEDYGEETRDEKQVYSRGHGARPPDGVD
jgi:hypothetical protein